MIWEKKKERYTAQERELFGYTKEMNELWYKKQRELDEKKLAANRKIILLQSVSKIILVIVTLFILGILFLWNSTGKLSAGNFIALLDGVVTLSAFLMENCVALAGEFADLNGFLKEFNEFCTYPCDTDAQVSAEPFLEKFESIEFCGVSFSYPGTKRMILKDFSCHMESGKRYAFVGENGCGKTTIVKLLVGLYDDYSGKILLNGKDIKNYSRGMLKSLFGVLYQDFSRYEISFVDNITLGRKNKDERKCLDTLYQKLGLSKIVDRLPEGENTMLGKLAEGGQELSGGEWQKLAMARLLYGDSQFLVMDEPTAALDPVSESKLYGLFGEITHDRTSLLITHRLGSIRTVDYVFLLRDGKFWRKEAVWGGLIFRVESGRGLRLQEDCIGSMS